MYNLAFLIPYYNHPAKIATLINILKGYNLNILIIDDGSNKEAKKALETIDEIEYLSFKDIIEKDMIEKQKIRIYTREQNGGKGAAIKDGLRIANLLGFSHVFQIDADMQHDLSDISSFINLSKEFENHIICGNPKYSDDAPKARLYGRKITDFWVALNTLSFKIKDSMCGFRIYPIKDIVPLLDYCPSDKMDFDIDILLLAAKAFIPFKWLDVKVAYEKNAISHFKGFRDNMLISALHARHFFLLPRHIKNLLFKDSKKCQDNERWYQKEEKAGAFWLKVSIKCVEILPKPLLRAVTYMVSLFYFLISHKERGHIARFYEQLEIYAGIKPKSVFSNFYNFAESIIDKIAVWKGKITLKDIDVVNLDSAKPRLSGANSVLPLQGNDTHTSSLRGSETTEAIYNANKQADLQVWVCTEGAARFAIARNDERNNNNAHNDENSNKNTPNDKTKGQIIITSHFGNTEIARALSRDNSDFDITILMYKSNAKAFLDLMSENSTAKILYVDEINLNTIFDLANIINNGSNLGIMGDRISIHGGKNMKMQFLGKECYFPQGAFLLSILLETEISALWCEKIHGKYRIEFEKIDKSAIENLSKREDKVKALMQQYIDLLEKRVMANPSAWFNFFDFLE